MQYYHLNSRAKRSSGAQRTLMLVNAVLFCAFVYVLALPFIN